MSDCGNINSFFPFVIFTHLLDKLISCNSQNETIKFQHEKLTKQHLLLFIYWPLVVQFMILFTFGNNKIYYKLNLLINCILGIDERELIKLCESLFPSIISSQYQEKREISNDDFEKILLFLFSELLNKKNFSIVLNWSIEIFSYLKETNASETIKCLTKNDNFIKEFNNYLNSLMKIPIDEMVRLTMKRFVKLDLQTKYRYVLLLQTNLIAKNEFPFVMYLINTFLYIFFFLSMLNYLGMKKSIDYYTFFKEHNLVHNLMNNNSKIALGWFVSFFFTAFSVCINYKEKHSLNDLKQNTKLINKYKELCSTLFSLDQNDKELYARKVKQVLNNILSLFYIANNKDNPLDKYIYLLFNYYLELFSNIFLSLIDDDYLLTCILKEQNIKLDIVKYDFLKTDKYKLVSMEDIQLSFEKEESYQIDGLAFDLSYITKQNTWAIFLIQSEQFDSQKEKVLLNWPTFSYSDNNHNKANIQHSFEGIFALIIEISNCFQNYMNSIEDIVENTSTSITSNPERISEWVSACLSRYGIRDQFLKDVRIRGLIFSLAHDPLLSDMKDKELEKKVVKSIKNHIDFDLLTKLYNVDIEIDYLFELAKTSNNKNINKLEYPDKEERLIKYYKLYEYKFDHLKLKHIKHFEDEDNNVLGDSNFVRDFKRRAYKKIKEEEGIQVSLNSIERAIIEYREMLDEVEIFSAISDVKQIFTACDASK